MCCNLTLNLANSFHIFQNAWYKQKLSLHIPPTSLQDVHSAVCIYSYEPRRERPCCPVCMYADTTFTLQAFWWTLQPHIQLRHKKFDYIQLNHKCVGYSQLQLTLTLHLLTIIRYRPRHCHYPMCLTVMYERLSLAISFYFRLLLNSKCCIMLSILCVRHYSMQ